MDESPAVPRRRCTALLSRGLAIGFALVLAACGGGGSSNSTATPSSSGTGSAQTLGVTISGSGTVVSNPSGVDCTSSCSTPFASGTAITLTAQPATGYVFSGWGGACSGTGSCNLTLNAASLVTAAFSSSSKGVDYVLTVDQTGSGTVTSNPAGINCQNSCSASFTSGASVALSAQPASGFSFTGWGGACSGNAACTVSMSSNQTVTATFAANAPTDYPLTVSVSGSGTVTSNTGGINCGSACSASLASGTAVTLTAQPASGYVFDGWGGACSGTSTCSVTMTAARSVSAAFSAQTPTSYSLVVSKSGSGTGTVTSSPAGISCGSTCTAQYASGTAVTLTAQAASGSTFAGWSGACSGTGSCAVTLSAARTVTATFNAAPVSYALTVTNAGGGTVTSSPGGISCGSTCSSSYTTGTVVTLTAAAASGYTFGGWSGACSGSASTCSVTMNAAQSVTASFSASAVTYALTVSTSGTGTGTVTSTPAGISCGSTCTFSFASGTSVSLNAQAASGSTFAGWGGACSGSGACTVTMSAAQSVTASYTLNSTGSGTLSIKVSGNHFVDANGNTVQLRGVNVAGLDGVAIAGWDPANPWGGDTGTPTPDWTTIKSWGVNSVRLLINEASWLGLTCADEGGYGVTIVNGQQVRNTPGQLIKADPGGNYQSTVATSVAQATAAGLYVVIDLHLNAPGNACPNVQNAMADQDHSIDYWTSMANTFKSYPNVIFELFNEPFLDQTSLTDGNPWPDLVNGTGTLSSFLVQGSPSVISYTWHNAGMQQMLNAVRATGATNVILTSTLAYSSSMGGWLQYHPVDTLTPSQVGAVWHAYPAPGYPTQVNCIGLPACSAQTMSDVQAIIAAGYPVVITEFGDVIGGTGSPWAQVLMPFADANGISYLAFCWDTWVQPSFVLITDAAGDPTAGYGQYVKAHLQCRAAGNASCP